MATRLLIVDDEETIRFAVKRYFTRIGFEVDCARELEEAEALATHINYGVVIADLSLTDSGSTEGLEIVRFMRRLSPQTRVIMLSAHGSPSVEAEAYKRGADAFVHKPQRLQQLAEIVHRLSPRT
ncbi:MAG TPA: response regulator [Thermoanaerobaculia bacterium]|nr:response regulator [Thermoanaerobaculia bacterium]